MSSSASKRLIKLVEEVEPPSPGISLNAVGKINVDQKVREDVLRCLYDIDPSEASWGLWFCEGLFAADKLDNNIIRALVEQIPSLLTCKDDKLRSRLVPLVIKLRGRVPKYRELMLQCLRDTNPAVRHYALLDSRTFLKKGEIEPLLVFASDGYIAELSMGGPLVYALRNEAFKQIEGSIGKIFEHRQLSQTVGAKEIAFWWDWQPVIDWWSRHQKRWRLWKDKT